jgi:hypothetical protein
MRNDDDLDFDLVLDAFPRLFEDEDLAPLLALAAEDLDEMVGPVSDPMLLAEAQR